MRRRSSASSLLFGRSMCILLTFSVCIHVRVKMSSLIWSKIKDVAICSCVASLIGLDVVICLKPCKLAESVEDHPPPLGAG